MKFVPPGARTSLGQALTNAVEPGSLVLQHCDNCDAVQYPPREVCRQCLSDQLKWKDTPVGGVVNTSTALHHSLEPFFKERLPWLMGSVKLDCGPVALVQLAQDCAATGTRVGVFNYIDSSGQSVLVAIAESLALDKDQVLEDMFTMYPPEKSS